MGIVFDELNVNGEKYTKIADTPFYKNNRGFMYQIKMGLNGLETTRIGHLSDDPKVLEKRVQDAVKDVAKRVNGSFF